MFEATNGTLSMKSNDLTKLKLFALVNNGYILGVDKFHNVYHEGKVIGTFTTYSQCIVHVVNTYLEAGDKLSNANNGVLIQKKDGVIKTFPIEVE